MRVARRWRHVRSPLPLSRLHSRALTFDVGAHALPHPRKKTGEDAHFLLSDALARRAALGVADGVGGAADSAWYSAILMANCESIIRADQHAGPVDALQMAWGNARAEHAVDGRSTACVVLLDGSSDDAGPMLRAANLGDSGFWVLRRRASGRLGVFFKSRPQVLSWNCPFQLGFLSGEELNTPADAEMVELPLQPGDAIVLATDGLFDILYPLEILELVETGLRQAQPAQELATSLVETAVERSKDPVRLSPVIEAMAREGFVARPREAQDDVTVVVAQISDAAATPPS